MSKHRVIVGVPGPSIKSETVAAAIHATREHDFSLLLENKPVDNFDEWWCDVLNEFEAGNCTHAAMLHADVVPDDWWLDIALAECDRLGAHVISAVIPKKGSTGCNSCGVSYPDGSMGVYRHFTMRDVFDLPETFGVDDIGYPGCTLLFNSGCMVIDLRDGRFVRAHHDGSLVCWFNFPREYGRLPGGRFGFRKGRSEDYWFAAQAQEALGARCYCTRKIGLYHGMPCFHNRAPWGSWMNGDEQNTKWREVLSGQPAQTY